MSVALMHLAALMVATTPTADVPTPPVSLQSPTPIVVNVAPIAHSAPFPSVLPKGTRLTIEIDEPLSSNTSIPASHFAIHLAEDVIVDGYRVLMAGATGDGEVVHAAKSGWGGKAGELIINARFLDCGGVRLPIGKMRFARRGADKVGEAFAMSMAFSPAAFMVSGGKLEISSGTRADAATLADLPLTMIEGTRCSVPANSSTPGVK